MEVESFALANDFPWPISQEVVSESDPVQFSDFVRRKYVEHLNSFFAPRTPIQLAKLFSLFIKEHPDNTFSSRVRSFNRIYDIPLISEDGKPREMDPHLWPAYRYVLTEIWVSRLEDETDTTVAAFNNFLRRKRQNSRNVVYTKFVDGSKNGKAILLKKETLTADEASDVEGDCRERFTEFLISLGVKASERSFVYSEETRRDAVEDAEEPEDEQYLDHFLEGSED
jgi:hypothetical protein